MTKRKSFRALALFIPICAVLAACANPESDWEEAKALDSIEAYSAYLEAWPDAEYSGAARQALSGLSLQQAVETREVVYNQQDGLIWSLDFKHNVTYEDAITYCADLNTAGRSGWRMPTFVELETVWDTLPQDPATLLLWTYVDETVPYPVIATRTTSTYMATFERERDWIPGGAVTSTVCAISEL